MITINKQKIIAEEQNYILDEVHISGGARGEFNARVSFAVTNEKGERIDTVLLDYTQDEFNAFWDNFNDAKFLYDELNVKEDLKIEVGEEVNATVRNVEKVEALEGSIEGAIIN